MIATTLSSEQNRAQALGDFCIVFVATVVKKVID